MPEKVRLHSLHNAGLFPVALRNLCWTRRVVNGLNRRVSNMPLSYAAVECQE